MYPQCLAGVSVAVIVVGGWQVIGAMLAAVFISFIAALLCTINRDRVVVLPPVAP